MRILITGSNGQLGSEFKKLSSYYKEFNLFFRDYDTLNICDTVHVKNFLKENKIDAIINCAAYTQVDLAENESDKAFEVNSKGVANLVINSEVLNIKIIHISTDYVFDGTSNIPYKEDDNTNPIGVYGKSKLEGEDYLVNSEVNGIIIRTSWLYSQFGDNFVKTIISLATKKDIIGVVSDQIGSPTYAKDLAIVCLEILEKKMILNLKGKIYHYSSFGVASWYDFAKSIIEFANIDCKVDALETKDYPTLAKRPHYSIFNKSKIIEDFNIKIPFWRESLKDCIKIITNSS